MSDPSQELRALAMLALSHATASVVDSGGPLIPFTMLEGVTGGTRIERFAGGPLEHCRDQALQRAAHDPEASRAVVAWDGYLTREGVRSDAVFVMAHERGEASSVVLAQRYRLVRQLLRKPRLEAFGPPEAAGQAAPLLVG